MFKEHSQVALSSPLPHLGLPAGALGVVVHVHGPGVAYEVEFFDASERTLGVETLSAQQLKPTAFDPAVRTAHA